MGHLKKAGERERKEKGLANEDKLKRTTIAMKLTSLYVVGPKSTASRRQVSNYKGLKPILNHQALT